MMSISMMTFLHPKVPRQQGFSLMELVVVMGLFGIIAAGGLVLISHLFKLEATVSSRFAAEDSIAMVKLALSDNTVCNHNLTLLTTASKILPTNLNGHSIALTKLEMPSGSGGTRVLILSVGQKVKDTLSVTRMSLTELRQVATSLTYLAKLKIVYTNQSKTYGSGTYVREIPIQLATNSSRIIQRCTTSSSQLL